MKKILLPTDFSKGAEVAVDYAMKLFKGEEVEFTLLHSYHVPYAGASMLVSVEDLLRTEAEKELEAYRSKLAAMHKDEPCEIKTHVAYGDVVTSINWFVNDYEVDLIVMGTSGASGIKEKLMGSNTSNTLRKVKVPVLAIPIACEFNPLKNVVLAADAKTPEMEKVLGPLKTFIDKYNSTVQVIHVEPEMVGQLASSAPSFQFDDIGGIKATTLEIRDNDVVRGIEEYVEDHAVDLLAMVAHQYSFLERLIGARSVSRKVAMHTQVPLLVLHD